MIVCFVEMVEDYLFSPDLLDIDLENSSAKFNPKLTIQNPGEGLKIRPLSREVGNGQLSTIKRNLGISTSEPCNLRYLMHF